MPQISVLMPAFNAVATIRQAIASVQAQTFRDWELIVVDDGSTDDTARLADDATVNDPRIRVIRRPHCGVLAQVRNAGIALAKADILGFLDSDDAYELDALQHLITYLHAHPECNLVYGQFLVVGEDDQPFKRQPASIRLHQDRYEVGPIPAHTWTNILSSRVSNQMQGLLIRRSVAEAVGGFPQNPPLWCPDFVFFAKVCAYNLQAVHALPIIAFRYRQSVSSMTYHPDYQLARVQSVEKEMQAIFNTPDLPIEAYHSRRRATAQQYFHRLRPICRHGRWHDMRMVLHHARPHVGRWLTAQLAIKGVALWAKYRLVPVC